LPDREPAIETQMNAYRLKHLLVLHATGTVDLAASKAALTQLVAGQGQDARNEVLLDLRDCECAMSATDVRELAEFMVLPNATPFPHARIAVLIDEHHRGQAAFNQAPTPDRCADQGVNMRTFEDYDNAKVWLNLR
jgi:hypothetical protein